MVYLTLSHITELTTVISINKITWSSLALIIKYFKKLISQNTTLAQRKIKILTYIYHKLEYVSSSDKSYDKWTITFYLTFTLELESLHLAWWWMSTLHTPDKCKTVHSMSKNKSWPLTSSPSLHCKQQTLGINLSAEPQNYCGNRGNMISHDG